MSKPVLVFDVPEDAPEPYPPGVYHPATGALITWEQAVALPEKVRQHVYYEVRRPDGSRAPRRPFYDDAGFFFEGANPDAPRMTREELNGLGITDDGLEAERKRMFGASRTDAPVLNGTADDDGKLQVYRREVYDACVREWYRPEASNAKGG